MIRADLLRQSHWVFCPAGVSEQGFQPAPIAHSNTEAQTTGIAGQNNGNSAALRLKNNGTTLTSHRQQNQQLAVEPKNYLNGKARLVLSWLLTTDHKRIAIALPTFSITVHVFSWVDSFAVLLMRLEPDFRPRNWLIQPRDVYNKLFTMHGIIMVWFFFLIPSIPNTLGNFLIPMMIGAKDLAFPKHQSG